MHEDMEKYEKVARYLDGEDVYLDSEAQTLLEEFQQDDKLLAEKFRVDLPPETAQQTSSMLNSAMQAGRAGRRTIRIVRWTTAAAAVAAAVVITLVMFHQISTSTEGLKNIVDGQKQNPSASIAKNQTQQIPISISKNSDDPSDDEIAVFLEPLFVDETAQTFLENGYGEMDLLDIYSDEAENDNVMRKSLLTGSAVG